MNKFYKERCIVVKNISRMFMNEMYENGFIYVFVTFLFFVSKYVKMIEV